MKQKIYLLLLFVFLFVRYGQGQTLDTIVPDTAIQEQAFDVTITGTNTNFTQGSTTLSFKQGSETMSPAEGMLEIISSTKLTASINILSNASGNWTALVDGLTLEDALHVMYIEVSADVAQNVTESDTFTVAVNMSEIPEDFQFVSSDFILTYNSNILNFLDVIQAGTLSENGTVEINEPTDGEITVAYMNSGLITGSGTLMKLQFAAIQPGSSSFTFSECYLNETPSQHLNGDNVAVNELVLPVANVSYSDEDKTVKEGDVLDITAVFSKPLESDPPLKIEITGANTVSPTTMSRLNDTTYTFAHTVGPGNGSANVLFSNAIDTSDNEVIAEPASGGTFIVDNTSPSASMIYSPSGPYSLDQNIEITAEIDEELADTKDLFIQLSGANNTEPMAMQRITARSFVKNYTITNGQGDVNVTLTNGEDFAGNEIVASPSSGAVFTIDALRLGDISNNGTIQSYDAALALQYSITGVEPNEPTPWENWRILQADVDGDGSILGYDASLILKYAAGVINTFPAQTKNGQAAPYAGIDIEVEDNTFLFKPYGELHSLNVEVINAENVEFLDVSPDVPGHEKLFFSNNDPKKPAFGLSLVEPFIVSDEVVKAEFASEGETSLTLRTIANTREETINVFTTGLNGKLLQKQIKVYPNPFTDRISFRLNFPEPTEVGIKLFSEIGRLITVVKEKQQIQGKQTIHWQPKRLVHQLPEVIIYDIFVNEKHIRGKLIRNY